MNTFPDEPRKVVKLNRHESRKQDKLRQKARSKLKSAPVGYDGQQYEITAPYAGNPSWVVGWANTKEGIASLCQMAILHPAMGKPSVRRLTFDERERLLAEKKKLPTK